MKIRCNKCHEDISKDIQGIFEQFEVGRVVCPKCKTKQKRYLSEADMLVYFAASALAYVLLFSIIMIMLQKMEIDIIAIVLMLVLFVIGLLFMKQLSLYIYDKAFFKYEIKDMIISENKDEIRKRMRWQFLMFMLVALFTGTMQGYEFYFITLLVMFVVVVGIKVYFAIKYEKKAARASKVIKEDK